MELELPKSALMWEVLLIAPLVAGLVWLVLGWEAEDRRVALERMRKAAQAKLRLLVAAMAQMGERLRVGLDLAPHAAAGVGLGAVSEMIDIVRLGLSAGLSFDSSLCLYCEGQEDALATRMDRARLSWQTGLATREEELLAVARDMGVRPLESFAVSVSQALELGAPLAETLDGQSREIRAAHRAEVERQIERAPVKLLIPTGTLILPALLLSILGPLLAAGGMI